MPPNIMSGSLVQDKNPVTQVLRYAKPELQDFCPVLRSGSYSLSFFSSEDLTLNKNQNFGIQTENSPPSVGCFQSSKRRVRARRARTLRFEDHTENCCVDVKYVENNAFRKAIYWFTN